MGIAATAAQQRVERINKLIAEYDDALRLCAEIRHTAARLEVERAEWVNGEIKRLMETGVKQTPADKLAHDDPKHRLYQRDLADQAFALDEQDRYARVTAQRLRLEQTLLTFDDVQAASVVVNVTAPPAIAAAGKEEA